MKLTGKSNRMMVTNFPFHIFSEILAFEKHCTAKKALGSWQFLSPQRLPLFHASQRYCTEVEGTATQSCTSLTPSQLTAQPASMGRRAPAAKNWGESRGIENTLRGVENCLGAGLTACSSAGPHRPHLCRCTASIAPLSCYVTSALFCLTICY